MSAAYNVMPGLVIDAFENTSRMHVMGLVLALCNRCWTFDAREFGPRHDAIAIASFVEAIVHELDEHRQVQIGSFCSDSDSASARMRRILARRWPSIIFLRVLLILSIVL